MLRRRLLPLFASLTLAALLSGCDLGALVPPVDVGDPLALDGQDVEVAMSEGGLAPAALASGTHTRDDLSIADVDLHGLSPSLFDVQAGFASDVVVTGEVSAAPETITVTRVDFTATIRDEANGSVTLERTTTPDAPFDKVACESGSCTYRYAGSADRTTLFDLEWAEAAKLAKLGTILSTAPSPNQGEVTVEVEVDSDPALVGLTATFELVSEGTTIEF